MTATLWEHQERAVNAALTAIGNGEAGGMWVMPTGSGKTVAFVTLAKRLGRPTLILVHRAELLNQAAAEVANRWPGATVGLLPGGGWESADVVVATVQSLSRKLDSFSPDRFGLVIVDEAHHAAAASWQKVLDHFKPAFRLGCTATPDRFDKKDVRGLIGEVLYEFPLADAMEGGIVVPVRQHGIITDVSLADVSVSGKDFAIKQLGSAVRGGERTRLVVDAYLGHAADRPALFFAVDLAHAEQLRQELVRRGVRAATVSGETADRERRGVLADFREGRLHALVNCDVLTEGYDEERISCE